METLREFMLRLRMQAGNTAPAAGQVAAMQQQWPQFTGLIASEVRLVHITRSGSEGTVIQNNQSSR